MSYDIEMEAIPSEEMVNNILADLTRVFVLEIVFQTLHSSGTAVVETVAYILKWKLSKTIMVKLMKIAHMWGNDNMAVLTSRNACEVVLTTTLYLADAGIDGLQNEVNCLFLWYGMNAVASSLAADPIERNWEPGKVLPKNEMTVRLRNQGPGTESVDAILTQVVHIHYQLFKFSETESDAMLWEASTTTP